MGDSNNPSNKNEEDKDALILVLRNQMKQFEERLNMVCDDSKGGISKRKHQDGPGHEGDDSRVAFAPNTKGGDGNNFQSRNNNDRNYDDYKNDYAGRNDYDRGH